MKIRPFFTILAAASVVAIAGLAGAPQAKAMPMAPITAPSVSDTASGAAVAPGSGLIEKVEDRGRDGMRGRGRGRGRGDGMRGRGRGRDFGDGGRGRGFCMMHPRRCRR